MCGLLYNRLAVISAEALFDGGGESVDEIEKLCEVCIPQTHCCMDCSVTSGIL